MNHYLRIFLPCLLLCLFTGCGDDGAGEVAGVIAPGSTTTFGETDLTPYLRGVERHPSGFKLHLTPHSSWMGPVVGLIQESGAAERPLVHAGTTVEKARAKAFVLTWGPSGETAELTFEIAPQELGRFGEATIKGEAVRAQSTTTPGTLDVGNGVSKMSFQQTSLTVTDEEQVSTASFENLTLADDQASQDWLKGISTDTVAVGPISVQTGTSTLVFTQAKPVKVGTQTSTVSNLLQVQSLEFSFTSLTFPESLTISSNLWTVDENYQIFYSVVGTKLRLEFTLKNGRDGWMGLGFNRFLFPTDTIVVWWDSETDSAVVWDAYNPGIPTLVSFPAPIRDDDPILSFPGSTPFDNKQNVEIVEASRTDDVITIVCERELITNDVYDFEIYQDREFYVWAGYNQYHTFVNEFNAPQPTYWVQASRLLKL